MADLTEDEIAFFATGELPESLTPTEEDPPPVVAKMEVEDPPADPVVEEPRITHDWDAINEQQRRINERLDAIAAKLEEKAKPAPVAEPDEYQDPLGAMLHKLNKTVTEVTELKTQLTQKEQDAEMRREFTAFTDNVKALKAEFVKETPDFDAAYSHIRAVRTEDLLATGVPKAEIQQMLLQDELRLASVAIDKGKNPAAEMYAMAKRYGYVAKAATQEKAEGSKQAPKGETAEEKVNRLKNGQFAARQPARGSTEVDLTLGGLSEASSGDLDKIVGNDNEWARIVGGKAGGNDVLH